MALRDTWLKTAVYFGFAEERAPDAHESQDAYEPEAQLQESYRERPNVRRLGARRPRGDFDDIFADDDAPRTTPLRAVRPGNGSTRVGGGGGNGGGSGSGGGGVRVHLVIPKSFNDAQQVADKFKDSIPVVLNLQATDNDLAKRLIDFASGLTYAMDGGMQRIADKVFMLTPRNVEISAEERASLIEKGFFNQS